MASQVAATTPDAGAVYEQAVRAVMARWTLLRLAVDQGWCDGDDPGEVHARCLPRPARRGRAGGRG